MNKEKAKIEIKKHLWGWGWKVMDVEGLPNFDCQLLINRKVQAWVLTSTEKEATRKRILSNINFIAIYVTGKCKGKRRFYSEGIFQSGGKWLFEEYSNVPNKILNKRLGRSF